MNPGSFSANTFYNVQDILLDMVSWGLLVEICELFKFLWRKVKRADVVLLSLLQKEHTDHYFYNSANTISFFFEGAWPLCDILFPFFSFHVRPSLTCLSTWMLARWWWSSPGGFCMVFGPIAHTSNSTDKLNSFENCLIQLAMVMNCEDCHDQVSESELRCKSYKRWGEEFLSDHTGIANCVNFWT